MVDDGIEALIDHEAWDASVEVERREQARWRPRAGSGDLGQPPPESCDTGTRGRRQRSGTRELAAVEVLALNMFGIADRNGQLITRRMVAERIAELGGHHAGCGCGLCELLPLVTATKVWRCASRWQADVNLTRLAAQRCAVPGQATTARVAV